MGASYTYRQKYSSFDALLSSLWPNEYLMAYAKFNVFETLSTSLMTQFLVATICLKNKAVELEYLKVRDIIFCSSKNSSNIQ